MQLLLLCYYVWHNATWETCMHVSISICKWSELTGCLKHIFLSSDTCFTTVMWHDHKKIYQNVAHKCTLREVKTPTRWQVVKSAHKLPYYYFN